MATSTGMGSWTSVTLAGDEMWGVEVGAMRVHCFQGTEPAEDDGFTLLEGQTITFRAGQTVHYREGRYRKSPGQFVRVELQA